MAGCRRSAYLEEEKPYMLPLPVSAFEPAVWSVAKVANDYLVTDGRNKYSVPYNLIGERVDIRVTKTTVEVFYHGSRVASHRRLQTRQRDPLVKREHMPPEHQKYLTYNADEFSRWAMSVGPMTEKVAEHFLKSGKAAEAGLQGLRWSDQTGTAVRQTAAGGSLRQNSGVQHHALAAHHCQHSEEMTWTSRTRPRANCRSPKPIATALPAARPTSGREVTADAEPGNDGYAHGNEDDPHMAAEFANPV